MANILNISRYSSLNFSEWKHYFEIQEDYRQVFSQTDVITVQYSVPTGTSIVLKLYNTENETIITPSLLLSNTTTDFYQFQLTGLEIDCYRIEIYFSGNVISYCRFDVLDDIELQDTVKLTFSNYRDEFGYEFIKETQNTFDFRCEGGFLYQDNTFQSDTETFRDQTFNIHNLSSYPYETNTLTLGTSRGVPDWVGRKANLIFSCSDVYVNGFKFERADGAEIEREDIMGAYPLYVFKLELEPSDFYNDSFVLSSEDVINSLLTEDGNEVITEDSNIIILE